MSAPMRSFGRVGSPKLMRANDVPSCDPNAQHPGSEFPAGSCDKAKEEVDLVFEVNPELEDQPIKERALAAVDLLQEAADRRGISLKLNKKPKKG